MDSRRVAARSNGACSKIKTIGKDPIVAPRAGLSGRARLLRSGPGHFAKVRSRVDAAPAAWGAAQAGRILFAVEEVVVVGEFFTGLDIAPRDDPDPSPDDVGLAIWLAGMIDKRGHTVAVHDVLAAIESEKIGYGRVVILIIGLIVAEALTHIFHDPRPLPNRGSRIATAGVDARFAKDQGHGTSFIFSTVGRGSGKRTFSLRTLRLRAFDRKGRKGLAKDAKKISG